MSRAGDTAGESCRTDNSRKIEDRKPLVRRDGEVKGAEVVAVAMVLLLGMPPFWLEGRFRKNIPPPPFGLGLNALFDRF